jgi:secreted trypsin-like serine protease
MMRRGDVRRRQTVGAIAFAVLLLSLTCATAAHAGGASASIVNGKAATIEEFPSLAYVQADEGKHGFSCTGTVVAPRVILTAGHCVEDPETGRITPASDYLVATGVADPSKSGPGNVFHVAEAHAFPDFDPGALRGDAALLILTAPTPAPPLPFAGAADAPLFEGGAIVQLAGWGLTSANAKQAPKSLRTTTTMVQGSTLCKNKTRSYYPPYSPAVQLCTLAPGAKKSGGCFGDSGGPVIAHRADGSPVELGIVSTGAPGCNPSLPNVFTRADYVGAWIAQWIAAAETGAPPPVVNAAGPLPRMSEETAEEFTAYTLLRTVGRRFAGASEIFGGCRRLNQTRFRCEVSWTVGRYAYAARISPYYLRRQDTNSWDSHYLIRWTVLSCLRSRKHCPVHSKHG